MVTQTNTYKVMIDFAIQSQIVTIIASSRQDAERIAISLPKCRPLRAYVISVTK